MGPDFVSLAGWDGRGQGGRVIGPARYGLWAGDVGPNPRRVEVVPVTEPVRKPLHEPSPPPVSPSQPEPTTSPELEPVGVPA